MRGNAMGAEQLESNAQQPELANIRTLSQVAELCLVQSSIHVRIEALQQDMCTLQGGASWTHQLGNQAGLTVQKGLEVFEPNADTPTLGPKDPQAPPASSASASVGCARGRGGCRPRQRLRRRICMCHTSTPSRDQWHTAPGPERHDNTKHDDTTMQLLHNTHDHTPTRSHTSPRATRLGLHHHTTAHPRDCTTARPHHNTTSRRIRRTARQHSPRATRRQTT
jgi:hypothetical protein